MQQRVGDRSSRSLTPSIPPSRNDSRPRDARVRLRAEERRAAAERTVRQQIQRIEQLIERADHARHGRRPDAARGRPNRARAAQPPSTRRSCPSANSRRWSERLRAAQAAIAPKLHELRELDEWKRFANAAVQEELIARTEALRAKYGFDTPEGVKPEDLEKAARELHEIQERWKQAAEAPRAQAQALWHRYRQAADPIQAKAREFFALRVEERKANLERKLALIDRAEALVAIERLDQDRRGTEEAAGGMAGDRPGAAPGHARPRWKRFREACDTFFTRRNADLAQRKETWAANQAKKEALCARAEELASSTDWERAAAEIRRLQAEWKNVGPVRRTKSEALWQRFRARVRHVLRPLQAARRDRARSAAGRSRSAGRGARVAGAGCRSDERLHAPEVMGDIAPAAPVAVENAALLERVRSLRSRWNQSSPAVRQGADPLSARFMNALERLIAAYPEAFRGTELDIEANRQKMEKLCERVEGFLRMSPPRRRARRRRSPTMLREALASNTIGGRARRRNEVARDGRRCPRRAGGVDAARSGARGGRPAAERPLPPRVQPLLRAVPAPHAAAAAAAAAARRKPVGATVEPRLQSRPDARVAGGSSAYALIAAIFPPTIV